MEIEQSYKPSSLGNEVTSNLPSLSPLSETLWREKAKPDIIGDVSARLTWKDLTVMVTLSNGEIQNVLENLTGYAEPGYFTALMGPSGSGKSTLLDALSSRLASNAFLSGTILLNGRKEKLSFGTAAYVTQDDNLIGTLTVRETIWYSARLRLPDKMSRSDKRALVESTIVAMGLQDCADTVIGNWHLRGISGGEKRRVSIALEILMRPRLLFLDEPTSGLDSASAFFVTQTLRALARDGRTVIASIHQPSSEVFELFDQLYLLSGGKTVYFGQASDAYEFFAQAGFPCPALRNPSDHFLRCINSDFDKVKATLKGSMKLRFEASDDPLDKITTAEAIRTLIDHYRTSQHSYAARQKVDDISKVRGTVLEAGGSEASFLLQCYILTKRSFINMSRDFGYYWLRLVIYIVVTICIGTIYLNVGTGYNSILARGSCASFVFGFVTFMSIGGFPSFVEDMKVFQRERLNGHYGVTAFVISNTLSATPFLILITFLSGTICYFMVNLHPGFSHYVFFVLALYASVTVVESLMMAIASIVPNFLMGIIIGAGIQGIFMLVSGYFRLPHDIPKPVWRYPMSYISFHYWALQGQYQNDLRGLLFDGETPDMPKIAGEYILEYVFQITVTRSKWIDLSVILSMIIIYRIIFFVMIKVNEDVTPWVRGYLARRRIQQKSGAQNTTIAPDVLTQSPSLRNYISNQSRN
ncbi:putative sulfate-transporting ATPase [Medicago truncatula]|uniref:Putative sulfate-transporting ATPase n=1 Tax=Medicago truncatula TaxID=3880 RepID=A0A072UC92_MEDTR|nr:ABC transporter G family member 11 [Medicago truncatula]KEH26658.1 white-brown-complex ABC transporter family protein, putative [Medicago truncatula]RHN52193.1 putative sulfate-transporting ATPase [Medicago truncatula]